MRAEAREHARGVSSLLVFAGPRGLGFRSNYSLARSSDSESTGWVGLGVQSRDRSVEYQVPRVEHSHVSEANMFVGCIDLSLVESIQT